MDETNDLQQTPLHIAAHQASLDCTQLLVKHGEFRETESLTWMSGDGLSVREESATSAPTLSKSSNTSMIRPLVQSSSTAT